MLYNLPFCLSIWFSLFSFNHMSNLTSLCSAANKIHSVIFRSTHSFLTAFMTKLSLHMSVLASDLTRLLQVNMPDGREKWQGKEQPSGGQESRNPSPQSKLKSNNFNKRLRASSQLERKETKKKK